MPAVWVRLRVELTRTARAVVTLALLVGVGGGIATAALAGSVRTETVVDRFDRAEGIPNVYIPPDFGDGESPEERAVSRGALTVEQVRSLPEVASAVPLTFFTIDRDLDAGTSLDPSAREVVGARLVEGRRLRPEAADEIEVSLSAAQTYRWKVGDTVSLRFARHDDPACGDESVREGISGPSHTLRIVGIVASLDDLNDLFTKGSVSLAPAFLRRNPQLACENLIVVKLRRGSADIPSFDRSLDRLAGRDVFFVDTTSAVTLVRRSVHVEAVSLLILGLVVAAGAVLMVAQTLSRHTFERSGDYPVLRALGVSRTGLFLLAILRAAIVAGVGAIIALPVAVALSPLAPTGLARRLEPAPGLSMPADVLAAAFAIIVVSVVLVTLPAAWRAATVSARVAPLPGSGQGSALLARVARLPGSPAPTVGVRMALSGRRSIPVRATIVGAVIGLAGVATTLTLRSSVDHLLDTPHLYGWSWDVTASGRFEPVSQGALGRILADPGVDAVAGGLTGIPLQIAGLRVEGMALDRVRGDVTPVVISGRAPASADEILLAKRTAETLGVRAGSQIEARLVFGEVDVPRRMRVTGTGVVPLRSDQSALGDGVVMTYQGVRAFYPDAPADSLFIRFKTGADRTAVMRILSEEFGERNLVAPEPPGSLRDLGRVSRTPVVLAALLSMLAAVTLTHGLVSAIRRRRREFAILKTIGFTRGNVRLAVSCQALTVAVIGVLAGVPLGVVAGRAVWTLLADNLAVVAFPVSSAAALAVMAASAVLVAGGIALLPARAAARTPPAVVLRTE